MVIRSSRWRVAVLAVSVGCFSGCGDALEDSLDSALIRQPRAGKISVELGLSDTLFIGDSMVQPMLERHDVISVGAGGVTTVSTFANAELVRQLDTPHWRRCVIWMGTDGMDRNFDSPELVAAAIDALVLTYAPHCGSILVLHPSNSQTVPIQTPYVDVRPWLAEHEATFPDDEYDGLHISRAIMVRMLAELTGDVWR